jgi:hypothetical protein
MDIQNGGCEHRNMEYTARRDVCPDCRYEFYYGDAHAKGEAQLSKLVNPGAAEGRKGRNNETN